MSANRGVKKHSYKLFQLLVYILSTIICSLKACDVLDVAKQSFQPQRLPFQLKALVQRLC